jgi:8-amino-3,8-dideoxy-alpha-D-manno-octulosonate transaminase
MYYCDDLEVKAIERVIKNKKLFRYQGKEIETECSLFEKDFAKHLNVKNTVLLSSGTNALVNALFCAGIGPGDEVLVPAYTFFATAAAVIELNAVPVIVNIDRYLSFDQVDLKQKITANTKAIIAVHMDGCPCDMDSLKALAKTHNLFLIEDVAQAVGGSYHNKKLGSIGDFGCYSFNMDKIISCGEGGAIAVNDNVIYQKAFLYHDTCNQFGPTSKDLYTISKFSGKSMRASEIQGAMMNVQLSRLPVILNDLRERKYILDEHLLSLGMELVPVYDKEGECGTTSRVYCKDIAMVNHLVLELSKLHFRANSPILRPAHNVWQWHSLLTSKQTKFDFLSSMDILARVLFIHVSLDGSLDEWKMMVGKIHA